MAYTLHQALVMIESARRCIRSLLKSGMQSLARATAVRVESALLEHRPQLNVHSRLRNGRKQSGDGRAGATTLETPIGQFGYPRGAGPEDILFDADRSADWTILMIRAQDGDALAYQLLLEEIAPYLRSLTSRWCVKGRDGELIVQDILLTLHLVRKIYDPSRPFTPWLENLARHRVRHCLRRPRHRRLMPRFLSIL